MAAVGVASSLDRGTELTIDGAKVVRVLAIADGGYEAAML